MVFFWVRCLSCSHQRRGSVITYCDRIFEGRYVGEERRYVGVKPLAWISSWVGDHRRIPTAVCFCLCQNWMLSSKGFFLTVVTYSQTRIEKMWALFSPGSLFFSRKTLFSNLLIPLLWISDLLEFATFPRQRQGDDERAVRLHDEKGR